MRGRGGPSPHTTDRVMQRTLRLFSIAAAVLCAVVVAPATGLAAGTPPPVPAPLQLTWLPGTDASGTIYTIELGATLSGTLSASDPVTGATVSIRPVGALPTGMQFVQADGNPGSAQVTWTPTAAQIGDYTVSFAATDNQTPALAAPTLTYTIHVVPLPQPTVFPLSGVGSVSRWALVLRPVIARTAPDSSAPAVARLATRTSDGTQNLVMLLASSVDGNSVWVRVRLPILPNNSTGWVPRSALGPFNVVTTHLYVDRELMTAVLYKNGKIVFRAHVGVGKPYWPTPRGEFYVRDRLAGFGDPFYGPVAFGTSARSAVLTDWPGGGFVGIHGTDMPGILPGHVSHGCIRMKNADILRLAKLMPVGTPVTIT